MTTTVSPFHPNPLLTNLNHYSIVSGQANLPIYLTQGPIIHPGFSTYQRVHSDSSHPPSIEHIHPALRSQFKVRYASPYTESLVLRVPSHRCTSSQGYASTHRIPGTPRMRYPDHVRPVRLFANRRFVWSTQCQQESRMGQVKLTCSVN